MFNPKVQSLMDKMGDTLTLEQKNDLCIRITQKRDFEKRAFDGLMLDTLKTILPEDQYQVVYDSALDHRCTKQFYHMDAMMDHLQHFLGPEKKDRRFSKTYRAARVLLKKYMPKAKLHPEDIDKYGIRLFSNEKGAAGAIAKGTKSTNADVCLDVAHRILDAIHAGKDFKDIFIPTMCYHRAQISDLLSDVGGFNPHFSMKDRMVEGVDGGTALVEASYFYGVYELFKREWHCYAGGKDPRTLRSTIHSWRRYHYWIGTDFSKFDMHLPSWVIEDAFDILEELYFDKEYWKVIDWVKYNFINTVMIGPDGDIYRKHKGIPSGSFCTQIIGTVANLLMNLTAIAEATEKQTVHEMVETMERELIYRNTNSLMLAAMGDDCLIFTNRPVDKQYVERIAETVTKVFGVMVKAEKTDYGRYDSDPLFLKREWKNGGEYQDPRKLFINLIHPEHDRKYDTYSPWHILFGLWLTYKYSFPARFDARFFFKKMDEHPSGIQALRDLPLRELPGVFRGIGESPTRYLYEWAEHHHNYS